MFRFRTSNILPIGLDLGAAGLRAMQLSVEQSTVRVIAAAQVAWPEEIAAGLAPGRVPTPQQAAPILARLHRQGGFVGRRIALALPRDLVTTKTLRLPPMPAEELQSAAEFELRQTMGLSDDVASVRSIPCGEVRTGTEVRHEVLTLAVKTEAIDDHVEAWHAHGFVPEAIDFEPAALYRSIERFVRRRDDEQEVHVLADIGRRRTQLLIGRGRELSFYKPIEVGGWQFTHAVSRKLGITADEAWTLRHRLIETAEAQQARGESVASVAPADSVKQAVIDAMRPIADHLARELATCLRYFSVNFRGARPLRMRVVGGEASDPIVRGVLASVLPIPVEAGRPVANAELSGMKVADRSGHLGAWTLVFGLALHGARGPFADRLGSTRASQALMESTTLEAKPEPITPGASIRIDSSTIDTPDFVDERAGRLEVARG